MTGPEHYKRAEQLEALAVETPSDQPELAAVVVARAQVHAILALADNVGSLVDAVRERPHSYPDGSTA